MIEDEINNADTEENITEIKQNIIEENIHLKQEVI